jgi:hypothetical protein
LLKSGKLKEAEEIKKNIEGKDKFNKTRIKWR